MREHLNGSSDDGRAGFGRRIRAQGGRKVGAGWAQSLARPAYTRHASPELR
ncbi:MAG TPA: hypothetical protein VMT85_01355 [Thermoanaerobaculia bacterium]|nr:hypothetical protein [Thermoanaerobaculia bacterium]